MLSALLSLFFFLDRPEFAVSQDLAQTAPARPSFAHPSLPEKTFTFEDAERLALINDARLLSAEQDKIIALERTREARYLFLPEIGLQGSATKYEARYPFSLSGNLGNLLLFPEHSSLGIDGLNSGTLYSGRGYLHMPLYEGRRTINTLRLAQAAQKQATSNYESVRMDLLLSVRETFYELILAQERVSSTNEYLAAVEAVFSSGRLDPWEKIEAEARLGEARFKASEALHSLELDRLAFLKNLNLELDTPFRVIGTLNTKAVDVDIEKAVLWALELRPELQSETYKAQMDAISVNLAAARRIPTVFVASSYELTGRQFPLRDNNWDASVGIRVPFSYDYWSQIKQKKAEQRQGQLKRAELQDRVRLEVRQAHETLRYWQQEWPRRETHYRKVQALYDSLSRQGSSLARLREHSEEMEDHRHGSS